MTWEEAFEEAAVKLFIEQCREWDVIEAAARLEWDKDPDLRAFWRRQVEIVVRTLRETKELPDNAGEEAPWRAQA